MRGAFVFHDPTSGANPMHHRRRVLSAALLGASALLLPADGRAQAWSYPAFQAPRVEPRELNFSFSDADPGTVLLFQWREGRSSRTQLSLDAGFVDDAFGGFSNDDDVLFVGGQFGQQLATANANMPFDFLLTVGVNFATSDPMTAIRVPVGVSIGHRFPLEGRMSITPWIHPRISIDHFNWDTGFDFRGRDDSETDANFVMDLGGSFEFSPNFALRLAASFGGDVLDDSFGVSLAWRPVGSRAPVGRPPRRG